LKWMCSVRSNLARLWVGWWFGGGR